MAPGMNMSQHSLVENIPGHTSSGTSVQPNSYEVGMLMTTKGKWRLMFHGEAYLNLLQQSGPRGADKVFSTNWFMPMAQRDLGPGQLTVRTMLSVEPGTISGERYPELFQQGETAFGRPIIDGQHPHDFLMEIAGIYDLKLGKEGLLSFYGGPVGEPAMGPTAYIHRASASEDPIAPLGHHLQDSTHIVDDVVTAAVTFRWLRVEASGFHGGEPDEHRWDFDSGPMDSWSTRVTVNPGQTWSMQYSIAHLTSPEAVHPDEDLRRMTASIMYNRPLARGSWATTLLWGRNSSLTQHQVFNGYLLESTLHFLQRNSLWTRMENVDRTSELLGDKAAGAPLPLADQFLARVQAYTVGYDRELPLIPQLSTALGGQLTLYQKPGFLTPLYGDHPMGFLLFLRVRPGGHH